MFVFTLLNCPHETSMSDYCLIGLAQLQLQPLLFVFQCIFCCLCLKCILRPTLGAKAPAAGVQVQNYHMSSSVSMHFYIYIRLPTDILVKICCSSEYGKQNKLRPQTNLLGEVQWPKNLSFQEFTVGGAGLKLSDRNTRIMKNCAFEIFPILRPLFSSFTLSNETSQWWKD